jgi:hypothetical protein
VNVRTLGLLWHPALDQFQVASGITPSTVEGHLNTKRKGVGCYSFSLWPTGTHCSGGHCLQNFMQTLWQVKLEWYEKLPQPLQLQWENLYDQLPAINDICINRRVLVTDVINIEIHGFCDSSERVYTACIYLRYTKCKQRNDSWTFVLQI